MRGITGRTEAGSRTPDDPFRCPDTLPDEHSIHRAGQDVEGSAVIFCEECFASKDTPCPACQDELICGECETLCYWCWMAANGNLDADSPRAQMVAAFCWGDALEPQG